MMTYRNQIALTLLLAFSLPFANADIVVAGGKDKLERHRFTSFKITRSTATHERAKQLERKLHKNKTCQPPPCKGQSTLDKMK